jgi:hypothetical protein
MLEQTLHTCKNKAMKHFKVKLKNPKEGLVDSEGFLCDIDGLPYVYTRGEALKKARMFGGGSVELLELSTVLHKVSMIQIPENGLLHGVIKELSGREMFNDADHDNTERIYSGDIFGQILEETLQREDTGFSPVSQKVIDQLNYLNQMCDAEYVQITNS